MNPAQNITDTPTNHASTSAAPTPAAAAASPIDNDPDGLSTLEAPPPYTPNPSFVSGEATLEHGPPRPFRSNPVPASTVRPGRQTPQAPAHNNLPASQSRSGLLQVLNNTISEFVTQLDNSQRAKPPRRAWSAYPGQQSLNTQSAIAPVQIETSPSSTSARPPPPVNPSSRTSSDFARDFYAAGTGDAAGVPPEFAPPPGPPPRLAQSTSGSGASNQNIGKPTKFPVVGHPLLRDGKLLVYPKNFRCDKCQNVGYKYTDPSRPCKPCWNKYAKPFSGPLAYSFSTFSDEGNFQRPLPPPRSSVSDSPGGFGGPSAPPRSVPQPTSSSFGYPAQVMSHSPSVPPPGSVVYNAGDPRLGGVLCWQCKGKGNVSFLFDRINCDICGGIGRVL